MYVIKAHKHHIIRQSERQKQIEIEFHLDKMLAVNRWGREPDDSVKKPFSRRALSDDSKRMAAQVCLLQYGVAQNVQRYWSLVFMFFFLMKKNQELNHHETEMSNYTFHGRMRVVGARDSYFSFKSAL